MADLGIWPCSNCVSLDAARDRRSWTPHVVVDTKPGGLTLIRCESCGHQREAQIEFLPERLTGEGALAFMPDAREAGE
jgi:hypothetical protein